MIDMAHPNFEADTPEWIPFDPTRHNRAWCANCCVFINEYFQGFGVRRRQIRIWVNRSAAGDKIKLVH
jgi:hypothetical protein